MWRNIIPLSEFYLMQLQLQFNLAAADLGGAYQNSEKRSA
jgi:hypothetical protein